MINASDDGPVYENPITQGQWILLEQLIDTSVFDEEQRAVWRRDIKDLDQDTVQEAINFLLNNQLNPVTHRASASQGEINRHLRKHI